MAARVTVALLALLVLQSAYLGVSASPNVFYVGNVFAHFAGGLVLAVAVVIQAIRGLRSAQSTGRGVALAGGVALGLFIASVIAALVLVAVHNERPHRWILYLHIGLASAAIMLALLVLGLVHRRTSSRFSGTSLRLLGSASAVAGLLVVLGSTAGRLRQDDTRIENPPRPPFEMSEEAMGGGTGPFFPSSAATSTGGRIPSNFFMTSEACARCHADIFKQWKSSAHHFSSFNNQWYRKSIEYMQSVNSVESSRWCAGCHDHAVLFNGMMDKPVAAFLATQEAHTGVSCNSCHAITHVKGTMGQGGFHIEYPPLHDMAVSEKAGLRWLHDFSVQLDSGPHRQVFLRSFHREQTADFCSACHKVHLDVPVNNYRWIRGFNEYDNWQASGVSGQGARSFYYPPEPMDCAKCHMPLVASHDKGNINGYVHDHSFLAANTALPVANLDEQQLARTIEFLQKNQVTVDIFAGGPARATDAAAPGGMGATMAGGAGEPRLSSTFAVGEESEAAAGAGRPGTAGAMREPEPVWAPLDRSDVALRRGDDVRIDVVVRTRGVGHFFPGGTVDAHEVWLELRATDEKGRMVFWSGVATDGGSGPVDEGAQFYRSQMVDAHGNPITRRNAWATRAVAWVNLIPPGAASVAHYRVHLPEDCGDSLRFEARLNYRKFTHVNTRFAFAGRPADGEPEPGPGQDRVTPHFDDRRFVSGTVPADVSAELREIPDLPIVVVHRAQVTLAVKNARTEVANRSAPTRREDWGRWNDYGIGLLLQGDLLGARQAFGQAIACDPANASSHVNVARVAVREGLLDEAEESLERALAREPDLASAHYFRGVVYKERGEYDRALEQLRMAEARYPRDRVVLNDIGRVLFLQRRYEEAIAALQQVLAVDPEDLMAHYNLMLCCKGLGQAEDAENEKRLYERFKADEDANMILGPYLREHPDDNRMRQAIHEQVSVAANVIAREAAIRAQAGEPNVVLPGQAAEYARRVVARGEELKAKGAGSKRYLGPIEAGRVAPVVPSKEPATRLAAKAGR